MSVCVVLGDRSDIATGMIPMLKDDGWDVYGFHRPMTIQEVTEQLGQGAIRKPWDLTICCLGVVAPVAMWYEQPSTAYRTIDAWGHCFKSNLLEPLRLTRALWPFRAPNAKICFMAGSNPNSIMPGYAAYNVSKMALLKAVEQMNVESEDLTIFALGPGVTDTKIHNATRAKNWPNPRLERADKDGSFTSIQSIYDSLKWCIAQDKRVVGGRNICVSDLQGSNELAACLALHPSMFKLRRYE